MSQIINNACTECNGNGSVTPVTIANCANQCCDGFLPVVPSTNLKTKLMLVHSVFDCVEQTSQTQFRNTNQQFKIINQVTDPETKYNPGESVCITKLSLTYDCIGLKEAHRVFINNSATSIPTIFISPPSCNCLHPLYNKFFFELPNPVFCCDTPAKNGVQVSLYEQDLDFSICGLKVVAEGIIANNPIPFVAVYEPGYILLSDLGFKTIDFFEKLCVPTSSDYLEINGEFKATKFSSDCAIATSTVKGLPRGAANPTSYVFDANIHICYEIKKILSIIINEKLSVVYDEDGPKCKPYPYPCTDK